MKKISVIFCLMFISLTAGANPPPASIESKIDLAEYRLICDPSGAAEFLNGLNGRAQCTFLEKNKWNYIKSHDRPCDTTPTGQFLAGFLGTACNTTSRLQEGVDTYKRIVTCDTSPKAQFFEGLLGKRACFETFDKVLEQ